MSEKFKPQEYFRYKRLGKRWRKPTGRQSKMRKKIAGAGLLPGVGRKKKTQPKPTIINNVKQLDALKKESSVLLAAGLGIRKAKIILDEADKRGIRIINKKGVRKALFFMKKIKEAKKKATEEKKKTEEKKTEQKETAEKKEEKSASVAVVGE
jgi:large subunit ribosomal protein L32e